MQISSQESKSTSQTAFRIVTSSALFDGHDAAINIVRRLLQKQGCHVIHLGHNHSVANIVQAAIQEDAHAICISSYQGGHVEFFKYIIDSLKEQKADYIQVFGGGGGTILPKEIKELESYGVRALYHPEDGKILGLEGMIKDLIIRLKDSLVVHTHFIQSPQNQMELSSSLSILARNPANYSLAKNSNPPPILGITGPGGSGKSSLVDEIILRYLGSNSKGKVAILALDPIKKKTGGALLGDRIRMNSIYSSRVFLRSLSIREFDLDFNAALSKQIAYLQTQDFEWIILETSGIGQSNDHITAFSDYQLYVMTQEYGASTQLEKIQMLDYADFIAINKFDKLGSEDAFNQVQYIYAYSRNIPFTDTNRKTLPVFGTIASDINDPSISQLFTCIAKKLALKIEPDRLFISPHQHSNTLIPHDRTFHLDESVKLYHQYQEDNQSVSHKLSNLYQLDKLLETQNWSSSTLTELKEKRATLSKEIPEEAFHKLQQFKHISQSYQEKHFNYQIKDKSITLDLFHKSLSGQSIPKIAIPSFNDYGDIYTFMTEENFPGYFPYTHGVFPFKNKIEDPQRQFAGEGPPERTNKRFHYLSKNDHFKRLSTAFDSVTLYGKDPAHRPDIYGKIGTSGVSIATLDHMKALYKDFDLNDPHTSVSMTINGPAHILLAMFFHTAIDGALSHQESPPSVEEYEVIKAKVLHTIRGTVQADILKEEQGQNTCIFSSKFALKMMGDLQEYFIQHRVKNFYSVSISGYHIAEAGANPITQVAFTLSNALTYVEYYLARGMSIDSFAANLSFFFSNGLDPEYAVIGRVARKIWAILLKKQYQANDKSCKLKYHIQTSGRSLHAQEMSFNDTRTTLQALFAIYDNCNSLHTNAFDEAITTPTEASVRQAMAIQMIINKELGTTLCDNPLMGSHFFNQLAKLVEEAILHEFSVISRRGGVLGALENQYQRYKIQTESMFYETKKSSGKLPIVGVNCFVSEDSSINYDELPVIRASTEEKEHQIATTQAFIKNAGSNNLKALESLKEKVMKGDNIFEALMDTVPYASLGQITDTLYQCGGEYRRSM